MFSVNRTGPRRLSRRIVLLAALVALSLGQSEGAVSAAPAAKASLVKPGYPVPPEDKKRLFFLQRSSNSNTVVYDANIDRNGRLDADEPVRVYWLRYNTDGKERDLSFLERHFAFGVETRPARDGGGGHMVSIVAKPELEFRVVIDKFGQAHAIGTYQGRPARLKSIYVTLDGGGFMPDVLFVDLYGEDVQSGKPIHGRIRP